MAQIILIASGKGGVGKSTAAVLLGESLSNRSKKVLIIELDCGFRSLDVSLGVSSSIIFDLGDIIRGTSTIADAAKPCPFCKNLSLICASALPCNLNPDSLEAICDAGKDFDYIIFDSSAGISDSMIAAATVSNLALVVVTADPSSVRAAKTTAAVIRDCGNSEVRLLLERCPEKSKDLYPFNNIDEIIDQTEIQLMGIMWEDRYTRAAIDTGSVLDCRSPNRKMADDLALRVMGNRVQLGIK